MKYAALAQAKPMPSDAPVAGVPSAIDNVGAKSYEPGQQKFSVGKNLAKDIVANVDNYDCCPGCDTGNGHNPLYSKSADNVVQISTVNQPQAEEPHADIQTGLENLTASLSSTAVNDNNNLASPVVSQSEGKGSYSSNSSPRSNEQKESYSSGNSFVFSSTTAESIVLNADNYDCCPGCDTGNGHNPLYSKSADNLVQESSQSNVSTAQTNEVSNSVSSFDVSIDTMFSETQQVGSTLQDKYASNGSQTTASTNYASQQSEARPEVAEKAYSSVSQQSVDLGEVASSFTNVDPSTSSQMDVSQATVISSQIGSEANYSANNTSITISDNSVIVQYAANDAGSSVDTTPSQDQATTNMQSSDARIDLAALVSSENVVEHNSMSFNIETGDSAIMEYAANDNIQQNQEITQSNYKHADSETIAERISSSYQSNEVNNVSQSVNNDLNIDLSSVVLSMNEGQIDSRVAQEAGDSVILQYAATSNEKVDVSQSYKENNVSEVSRSDAQSQSSRYIANKMDLDGDQALDALDGVVGKTASKYQPHSKEGERVYSGSHNQIEQKYQGTVLESDDGIESDSDKEKKLFSKVAKKKVKKSSSKPSETKKVTKDVDIRKIHTKKKAVRKKNLQSKSGGKNGYSTTRRNRSRKSSKVRNKRN